MLQPRQLLRDLVPFVTWWALPLHDWPSLVYATDVETAAKDIEGTIPRRKLLQAWRLRHKGIRSQPKMLSVSKVTFNPCRFGTCVCTVHWHGKPIVRHRKVGTGRYCAFLDWPVCGGPSRRNCCPQTKDYGIRASLCLSACQT